MCGCRSRAAAFGSCTGYNWDDLLPNAGWSGRFAPRLPPTVAHRSICSSACGKSYRLDQSKLGRSVRCQQCGESFTISSTAGIELGESPADQDAEWYYQQHDEQFGPFTAGELRAKIATGVIPHDCSVRKGTDGNSFQALHAKGLFATQGSRLPERRPPPHPKDLRVIVSEPPSLPTQNPNNDELPSQIGRFEIRQRLGAGYFANVYLAHDAMTVLPGRIRARRIRAGEAKKLYG